MVRTSPGQRGARGRGRVWSERLRTLDLEPTTEECAEPLCRVLWQLRPWVVSGRVADQASAPLVRSEVGQARPAVADVALQLGTRVRIQSVLHVVEESLDDVATRRAHSRGPPLARVAELRVTTRIDEAQGVCAVVTRPPRPTRVERASSRRASSRPRRRPGRARAGRGPTKPHPAPGGPQDAPRFRPARPWRSLRPGAPDRPSPRPVPPGKFR